jgi:charged multivesicular body protein 3
MSVGNALTEQMALVKVAGTISQSTEVMKEVSSLLKVPQIQRDMMEMSKGEGLSVFAHHHHKLELFLPTLCAEMMKAGLIEEMINDALDSALDTEDMEEETEEQIDQVKGFFS